MGESTFTSVMRSFFNTVWLPRSSREIWSSGAGAAALLGWGGLSVHCQTAAVLRGAGLSLRPYLCGKALQAALSAAAAAFTAQWIL